VVGTLTPVGMLMMGICNLYTRISFMRLLPSLLAVFTTAENTQVKCGSCGWCLCLCHQNCKLLSSCRVQFAHLPSLGDLDTPVHLTFEWGLKFLTKKTHA
jgi:hypothetical protein